MKHIIWDWNGTLFDDLDLCFSCINRLLLSYGLTPLKNIEAYRNVFDFPIQKYYQAIGFDFDRVPYEILAEDYMKDYQNKSFDCSLHQDAISTLQLAKSRNIKQTILSASQLDYLRQQISLFPLEGLVDHICGIQDIYAHGKLDLARSYVSTCDEQDEIWFVGDSIHDHEVAQALSCHCVLISSGHQSHERLLKTGAPVFSTLLNGLDYIYERDMDSKE